MQKIAIMGLGFVGAALARYFKLQGVEVGHYDPPKGLNDISILRDAEIIFIAVPTPYYLPDRQAGLDGTGFDDSYIQTALKTIPVPGKTIVLKSTILPGTTDKIQQLFPQHRVLFNPEFLTQAIADQDMQKPRRQIVGFTQQSRRDAEAVMGILPRAPFEKIIPAKAAELVKYFGNAFYALKVAYANQMYDLCHKLCVDYELVKDCAKAEPWIGEQHLEIFYQGYRGYGGKCLPKDTRAIIHLAEQLNADLSLLKKAEEYNNDLVSKQGLDIQWEEGSPKKGSL
jgi:UDPglucose 6-dehydrogenase